MKTILAAVSMVCACAVTNAHADGAIYGAVGTSSVQSPAGYEKLDMTPWSIGFVVRSKTSPVVLGLDYSQEGIRYDTTWGYRPSVKLSNSYNVLLGTKIFDNDVVRLDAAAVIGTREASSACQGSYLGYRCFANQAPDIKYKFNYGALITLSYQNVLIGIRATEVSKQMVFGVRF